MTNAMTSRFPTSGFSKQKESILGFAALLVFYGSQLATAQAASCVLTHPCHKGPNRSIAVAMAQTGAPSQLTVTPGNGTLKVRWEPPTGSSHSRNIEYDIQYSKDGGSTWWPWHISSRLEDLIVEISGLKNGTTYIVRMRAKGSQGYGPWSDSVSATPVGVPAAPVQLNVIPDDQKLALSWLAPAADGGSEIRDYDIQYSTDSRATSTLWNESPESTTLREQMTNLNNGVNYHLRVRARNGIGPGPWSDWAAGQPATIPAAPDPPTLTPGNGQLQVSWAAPDNDGGARIISYHLQYSADDSTWKQWHIPAEEQPILQTTIVGLDNGAAYAVQVRAENEHGHGSWSDSARDQPLGVPAAPERPALTPGNQELHVSWDAPGDDGGAPISSYDVQYSSNHGSTWNQRDVSIDLQNLQATITSLQNNTIYHVQVRARNSQGDGAWSVAALGQPAGLPAAPTRVTLTPRHNQLEVSWNRPFDDGGTPIIDYDIQYSSDRGATWQPWHGSSESENLMANISGLNNGTAYVVRVRARNGQGYGQWSASASGMPVGLPAAPTRLKLMSGDRKLTLTWVAPADNGGSKIIGYSIQYSDDDGSTWRPWNASIDSQQLQETIMDLENSKGYQVQVRARNRQGDGPWSAWEEGQPATTPAAPAPPVLTPRNRQLRASWDAPDNDGGDRVIGYHIRYSADDGSTWRTWHTPADAQPILQTTIAGLENGTTYAVQVRARNHQGDGQWSTSSLDQPLGVPMAPPPPDLTPGNHQLHVQWNAPNDDGGAPIRSYDIRYSNDSGSTWNELDNPIDPQVFQETITGLQNGTVYRVQVRARNSEGGGQWSAWKEAQPRRLPPWLQRPLSGLIWPIIVAIIASSVASIFLKNIKKTMKNPLSLLKQGLFKSRERKSDHSISPKATENKDNPNQG